MACSASGSGAAATGALQALARRLAPLRDDPRRRSTSSAGRTRRARRDDVRATLGAERRRRQQCGVRGARACAHRRRSPGARRSSVAASSATIDQDLPPDVDLVAVAQEMLRDGGAVDERAVGAAEILQERIVENRHDRRMLAAHRRVREADVVVRTAADRDALAVELDLERRAVGLEVHELAHGRRLRPLARALLREPALRPGGVRQERLRHPDEHDGDVVAPAILVGDVDQLLRRLGQVVALRCSMIECTIAGSTMSVRPSELSR